MHVALREKQTPWPWQPASHTAAGIEQLKPTYCGLHVHTGPSSPRPPSPSAHQEEPEAAGGAQHPFELQLTASSQWAWRFPHEAPWNPQSHRQEPLFRHSPWPEHVVSGAQATAHVKPT